MKIVSILNEFKVLINAIIIIVIFSLKHCGIAPDIKTLEILLKKEVCSLTVQGAV